MFLTATTTAISTAIMTANANTNYWDLVHGTRKKPGHKILCQMVMLYELT